MPVIIDNRVVTLRIPKAASTAFWHAIHRAVGVGRYREWGKTHYTIAQSTAWMNPTAPIITMVREPHTWLQSIWAEIVKTGYETTKPYTGEYPDFQVPLNECFRPKFVDFIEAYLKKHPGWVTKYFEKFTGPRPEVLNRKTHRTSDTHPHFVGRCELLCAELIRFFQVLDVPFDEAGLRGVGFMNRVASLPEFAAQKQYPHDLLAAVLKAENEIYDRFYGLGRYYSR